MKTDIRTLHRSRRDRSGEGIQMKTDIQELRKLLAATPGPWYSIEHPEWKNAPHRIDNDPNARHGSFGQIAYMHPASAQSAVACHNAMPALLDELEALRAVVDKLPKTEDGVHVVEDHVGPKTVWMRRGERPVEMTVTAGLVANKTVWPLCFASRKAALEAAKENK